MAFVRLAFDVPLQLCSVASRVKLSDAPARDSHRIGSDQPRQAAAAAAAPAPTSTSTPGTRPPPQVSCRVVCVCARARAALLTVSVRRDDIEGACGCRRIREPLNPDADGLLMCLRILMVRRETLFNFCRKGCLHTPLL
uniref:Uncharacterized protein n=1 Tax=Setaria viridis TaxID=4556 RepID=A0A4U6T2H2_SETVI|nr:hypothetical protein SEVIR_9G317700v2 [Setaria viridis]